MQENQINRFSGFLLLALSLGALLAVLGGYLRPAQPDEGAAAHIFQLSVAAFLPVLLLFCATADWKQPRRSSRRLIIPSAALMLAFSALYYLEHYRM